MASLERETPEWHIERELIEWQESVVAKPPIEKQTPEWHMPR